MQVNHVPHRTTVDVFRKSIIDIHKKTIKNNDNLYRLRLITFLTQFSLLFRNYVIYVYRVYL